MNDSKKKIQFQFLQSAKSRVLLAIVLVIVTAVAIGFVIHWRSRVAAEAATASVSGTPVISSIPGAGNPSAAYVAAQTTANIQGEIAARKSATAFVPTITRAGFVGDPNQFGAESTTGTGDTSASQCGVKKVVVMYKPNPASCTAPNLKTARETGVTAEELVCQGCSCPALKLAGYTVGDLKQIGLTATELHACGFDLQALMDAGFSAQDLKNAGFSAQDLKNAGFSAAQLKDAGFSPTDLKNAGFSAAQLKDAGFSAASLKDAGFSAQDLKNAGFSAAQLKNAGFSPADLKNAGFSAAQLKNAGFSAASLKDAGFTDANLAAAGFSPAEIKAANEMSTVCNVDKLKQERAAGVSAAALKEKGCGAEALKAAGFTAQELKAAGYSAGALKTAGFSNAALAAAGFSPADIKAADAAFAAANCNVDKLKQERAAGVSAAALKEKGCGAEALKAAGFTAQQLKDAGFSAAQLKDAGFSAAALRSAGFSAAQLKNAGYSAGELKDAGFSAQALKQAGFSAGQLVSAGFSPKTLRDAGFSAAELRRAGMSASALRDAGFSPSELKAAGFTKGDLLRAGFTPADAGYSETTPTTAGSGSTSTLESGLTQSGATAAGLPTMDANSPEARLAQFEKQQQADMSAQQRADHIQRAQAMMSEQAGKLLEGWSNFSTQQLQKAPEEKKSTTASSARGNGASAASTGAESSDGPTIKAGSVLFAVIETSINSDENTPIMAHIVAGELKGSKLLGTFTRTHKKLLINFTVLSDPHYPKSLPINAVAIDPDTARTALSGQVNSHYLLRYGTLFASSFLQGVSEGIVTQGLSSNCLVGNFGCTIQQSPLDSRQQLTMGLGKVGSAYAQHMGENFNRAPTVRVPAGTGVGVLLMGDLTLPMNLPPKKSN